MKNWIKVMTIACVILFYKSLNAQGIIETTRDYQFLGQAELQKLITENDSTDIDLFNRKVYEYEVQEDGSIINNFLIHHANIIRTEKGIEENNKLYLPFSKEVASLTDFNVKVYSGDNIFNFGKEDILVSEDKEKGVSYNYIALEGVTKGSIVEYYYILKTQPYYRGKEVYLQSKEECLSQNFQLIYPVHHEYKFKSYNGVPDLKIDTLSDDYHTLFLSNYHSEKLDKEVYGNFNKERGKIKFKLSKNLSRGNSNLFSYETVAQGVYENLIGEGLSKKESSAIKKFIGPLKKLKSFSTEEKIIQIENFVKEKIQYNPESDRKKEDGELSFALKNGYTSKRGLVKVFCAIFDYYKIEYSLVLTSDKNDEYFYKDFFQYSYLEEYLFYFPTEDLYLEPLHAFNRLGYISSEYRGNNGLFIERVDLGGMFTAIGSIKKIKYSNSNTMDSMIVSISFEDDIMVPKVTFESHKTGYSALDFLPYFDVLSKNNNKEALDNFKESITKLYDEDMVVIKSDFENTSMSDFPSKALITKTVYTTESVIEQAGDKILFKVGLIIGPQMELYNENERKLDIELYNKKVYKRKIIVNIPKGYTVAGLDKVDLTILPSELSESNLAFKTTHQIVGDQLIIYNTEYYNEEFIAKKYYDDYQKVVNAAADFNKIILVLEKK
jgi:hypothetical protein